MFCTNCGSKVDEHDKFCTSCGKLLKSPKEDESLKNEEPSGSAETAATAATSGKDFSSQVKGMFSQATQTINEMVGEKGAIDLDLKDVFSSVFKKHTKEEAETLFVAGTKLTTPNEKDISTSWPKPWLFFRVFLVFALAYFLLYICTYSFQNTKAIPGLMTIGSIAVPFSLLIFFWEMNAPRNISIYEVSKMFFVGGSFSLVITLFLYTFFPTVGYSYTGAIVVGIVEEIGKLVIIAFFIYRLNTKYILNGLLLGAAIGAGFAFFESAGYAFDIGLAYGDQAMLSNIFNRAWMSVGTHGVWAAIAGAALVYVKGTRQLKREDFFNGRFIKLFIVPVILHAVWDMPIEMFPTVRFIILIVVAWVFIFTLINAGLKQITRLNAKPPQPLPVTGDSV